MTESMIERVARAIYDEAADKPYATDLEPIARAAIEAMREPTREMLAAGMNEEGVDLLSEWRAMIDAALKDNSVA